MFTNGTVICFLRLHLTLHKQTKNVCRKPSQEQPSHGCGEAVVSPIDVYCPHKHLWVMEDKQFTNHYSKTTIAFNINKLTF